MIVTDYQAQVQQQSQSHLTVGGSGAGGTAEHSLQAGGDFSIDGIKTPTTPTAPALMHQEQALIQQQQQHGSNGAASPAAQSVQPLASRPSTSSTLIGNHSPSESSLSAQTSTAASSNSAGRSREREPSSSNVSSSTSDPNNPYRSFRVTLEDPCYKVLPAALKKYKINDDWRLYALFICYGNTGKFLFAVIEFSKVTVSLTDNSSSRSERCLAYDEKPLLLFQRLKESNDNPVFMLRHIKDIKSPISVASAKHAARREKRLPGVGTGVERSLMGVNRDGSSTVVNASGLVGNARPTRLHHPPVLLPVGKERETPGAKSEDEETGEGGKKEASKDKDVAKKGADRGYCIAIYPYLAEREDEFDVAVGDSEAFPPPRRLFAFD